MRNDGPSSIREGDVEGNGGVCAFVGPGVEFKGSIRYDGTVRVDGSVEGEVETGGSLIVGRGAILHAKVNAGVVVCEGTIMGDVAAREKVQLLAPAVVHGSVTSPVLAIEEGVLLRGKVAMIAAERREALHAEVAQ